MNFNRHEKKEKKKRLWSYGSKHIYVTICIVSRKYLVVLLMMVTLIIRIITMKLHPGFFKKICTGMLKLDFRISTISICLILWPISIPNCHKNHLIQNKLGAFLAKFSKIHPILQIERNSRSGTETIYRYTKYDEKAPLSLWESPYIINQD